MPELAEQRFPETLSESKDGELMGEDTQHQPLPTTHTCAQTHTHIVDQKTKWLTHWKMALQMFMHMCKAFSPRDPFKQCDAYLTSEACESKAILRIVFMFDV